MAPSAGAAFQLLHGAVRQARAAWNKATRVVEQLPKQASQAQAQPIPARIAPRHPLHPVAALRQSKGRWYTTHAAIKAGTRNFSSSTRYGAQPARTLRSAFPKSRIADAIRQLPGRARAPFASTLRPNLTGGTLGRTAGGYGFGSGRIGGQRFFSHAPTAQAQVVQNVSQAVRAFLIGGHKAQFDGFDERGNKHFRAVTALQKEASRKLAVVPRATPGSFVDFSINPTITALTPLSSVAGFPQESDTEYGYAYSNSHDAPAGLASTGLLDVLSADFSRALKDLAVILNDLKALSGLGDLPITYQPDGRLRVHFPGCDADTLDALCAELGVRRGIVGQDAEFDAFAGTEVALLFPFAPSRSPSECEFFEKAPIGARQVPWRDMLSEHDVDSDSDSELGLSTRSVGDWPDDDEHDGAAGGEAEYLSSRSPSGYESIESAHLISDHGAASVAADGKAPLEFQGFEGLYRFMEMCDESEGGARYRRAL